MKRCTPLLICFLAISGASADSGDPHLSAPHPSAPRLSLAARVAAASSPRAGLDGLRADVVRDVRATSAYVREQAGGAAAPSRWLMALAACGLITMQLRRKHKSLPQRRIAPYG